MNNLVYAIGDFFMSVFSLMDKIGSVTNLVFIGFISFFTIYWIREMIKNPEKTN